MTPEELTSIISSTEWLKQGHGSYNNVTASEKQLTIEGFTCYWVLKSPIDSSDNLSTTARAVRKWKEINPEYPAYLTSKGMLVPYFGTTQASDSQIANKVVEHYRRTRNLILDASSPNNFLVWDSKVICIDVDLALRRGSVPSAGFDIGSSTVTQFLNKTSHEGGAQTTSVIRTLIYIQKYLSPEEVKDEYITLQFIEKLHVLRRGNVVLTPEIMERLLELIRFDKANEITDNLLIEFVNTGRATAPAENGKIHVIHLAANSGLLNLIKSLVEHNPMLVNVRDAFNQNPLHWSVYTGRKSVIEFLVAQEGTDINAAIQLPLSHAEHRLRHNSTTLDTVVLLGHFSTMAILQRAGAIANCLNRDTAAPAKIATLPTLIAKLRVLHRGSVVMNADKLEQLLELINFDIANEISDDHLVEFINTGRVAAPAENGKLHIIHLAVKYGLLNLVRTMVTHNPALAYVKDVLDQSPLHWAACGGREQIAAFLISQSGVDVNAKIKLSPYNVRFKGVHNFTALDYAITRGNLPTVAILQSAGAIANCLPKDTSATEGRAPPATLTRSWCDFFHQALSYVPAIHFGTVESLYPINKP